MRWAAVVLVVLVAAVTGLSQWFRHDLELAQDRIAGGSEVAATPCGRIEYSVEGQGPAVLVAHGSGGGYDQADAFGERLAQAGFRAISPSRFGYLRTPLPADASPAAQADAYACLLDALRVERAAIVGASAGAPSSLQFALRHPGRTTALVLVVPATWAPPEDEAGPVVHPAPATELAFETALKSDFLYWAARRLAPGTLTRALLATDPAQVEAAPPSEQARVARLLDDIFPVSPRAGGLMNDARVIAQLTRYPLERIAAPTLVVSVRDDLFGTWEAARYTASQVPGARFHGFETGGHVWVGHHDELMDLVTGFLRNSRRPKAD